MDDTKRENRPDQYIIRIQNHLDTHWENWFDGLTIQHRARGQTILSGEVEDQSALLGLLEKIHNLNLTLISVRKIAHKKEL